MWDSIWININLATMTEKDGYGILENAALGVRDGKIAWVGAQTDLPSAPENAAHRVHDGQGRWVTPGLTDCHTHLVYGGNRAKEFEMRLNGISYEEIAKKGGGIISTVRATRAATEEEMYESAIKRLRALMREGVTGIEIKSGYGLDTESEAKIMRVATRLHDEAGLRVQRTFLGAHALPPEFEGRADDYIDHICRHMMPTLHREGLIDAVDAFCERIGFTPAQTQRVFSKAAELGLPVKLHAEQISNQGGAKLAAQYKALSADHLEYLDEDGVKAMAQSGTVAVLLPGAFYFLRETKLPPVELLRKYKVPMALATDCNPGTSPTTSLLLMMNMACILFRLTPLEALRGVTVNAAQALGWRNQCGTLEEGKDADFALWDIAHPAELSCYLGYNPCVGVVRSGICGDFAAI